MASLHKLIVSQRRRKEIKREKDVATARGLFEFFEGKEKHCNRLRQIYDGFPKGLQKKIINTVIYTAIIRFAKWLVNVEIEKCSPQTKTSEFSLSTK